MIWQVPPRARAPRPVRLAFVLSLVGAIGVPARCAQAAEGPPAAAADLMAAGGKAFKEGRYAEAIELGTRALEAGAHRKDVELVEIPELLTHQ